MQGIFACLQTHLVAYRARGGRGGAAESAALIPDYRFHGGQQLSGGHHTHGYPSAPEHRFNDFAVAVARYQDAILNIVSPHNTAGRNAQIEDRIPRRGKLVNHFLGGRATIEDARITLFQDDHAASLDSVIARVNGGGHKVRESNVGDETTALLHLEDGLFPRLPFDDTDLAVKHAGVYADIGNRLGQAERAAPGLAILAGLWGSRKFHVTILLFRGAALVNRCQSKTSGEAGGGSASVHPS